MINAGQETHVTGSGGRGTKGTLYSPQYATRWPSPRPSANGARSTDKSPFLRQCMEGSLPGSVSLSLLKKVTVCSLGWSLACPWHPEPLFKQNISTLPNVHKMPFSVPLLVRNTSALPRMQAPSGSQILKIRFRKDGKERSVRTVLKQ